MNPRDFNWKKGSLEFRLLREEETQILGQAVEIDKQSWGKNFKVDLPQFQARCRNGFVIGCFQKGELQGTISTLQVKSSELLKIGREKIWCDTWNGVTGNASLSTQNSEGDVLACVSVTSKSADSKAEEIISDSAWFSNFSGKITKENLLLALKEKNFDKEKEMNSFVHTLSDELVDAYLKTNIDFVLRFHRKPKGGLSKGAEVWIKVKNGRADDLDAIGWNAVLRYPEINSREPAPESNEEVSVGIGLV
ncbi:MAG: hypothetical protein Q7K42_00520, partial [Candidatus Diapherotrites archaeon]|nr:hypothetical protein [Candidatus Diapherotrites archaeon]